MDSDRAGGYYRGAEGLGDKGTGENKLINFSNLKSSTEGILITNVQFIGNYNCYHKGLHN